MKYWKAFRAMTAAPAALHMQVFLEDIVRGYFNITDCIFILRDRLKVMAQQMVDMSNTKRE